MVTFAVPHLEIVMVKYQLLRILDLVAGCLFLHRLHIISREDNVIKDLRLHVFSYLLLLLLAV